MSDYIDEFVKDRSQKVRDEAERDYRICVKYVTKSTGKKETELTAEDFAEAARVTNSLGPMAIIPEKLAMIATNFDAIRAEFGASSE